MEELPALAGALPDGAAMPESHAPVLFFRLLFAVVVVVSARKGVTDELLGQMRLFGGPAEAAATDLLLATGELQSADYLLE